MNNRDEIGDSCNDWEPAREMTVLVDNDRSLMQEGSDPEEENWC